MHHLLDVSIQRKHFFYPPIHEKKRAVLLKPKKIVMGTFSQAIDYAPFYIAKRRGWFSLLNSIEIEYKEFNNFFAVEKAFNDNEIDIFFSAEPPVNELVSRGVVCKPIGTITSVNLEMIVHSNSDIRKVQDLIHRKIGVLKGTSSHFSLLRILEQNSISLDTVEIIDLIPEEAKKEFADENIDCWAIWPPFVQEQLIGGKARVLPKSNGSVSVLCSAREGVMLNSPHIVNVVIEALNKAKQWIRLNAKEAKRLVCEELSISREITDLAWDQNDFQINFSTNVILTDIAFSVPRHQFTTILGPSGCGKSTLLRIIAGLDTQYEGTIKINNSRVSSTTKDCGIMFQEHRLFPWMTVKDNIFFGLETRDEKRVSELLTLFKIESFSNSYPHELSGGMNQRVAMARAFADIPTLLLLDEPFNSLDVSIKQKLHIQMSDAIQRASATALMVTHDIDEAVFLSDVILIMSKRPGQIVRQFSIDLPRPRNRESLEFMKVQRDILTYMKNELNLF